MRPYNITFAAFVALLGIASLVGRATAENVPRSLEEKVADSDFIAVGEVIATAPSRMVLLHTYTRPDGTEEDITTEIDVLKLGVSKVLKGDRSRVNKVDDKNPVAFVYLATVKATSRVHSTKPTAKVGEKGIWLMKHDSILTGLLFLNSSVIEPDKLGQIEAMIEEQTKTPFLAALLTYDHNVVIVANDKSAAVIRLEETAPFTVKYRYRLMTFDSGEEVVGEGALFDQPKSEKPASIWLKVGPFRRQWSYSAQGRGWFYYRPEQVRMYVAKKEFFEDLRLQRFANRDL